MLGVNKIDQYVLSWSFNSSTESQSTNVYTDKSLNIMETTIVVKQSTGSLEIHQRGVGKWAVRNTGGTGNTSTNAKHIDQG